MARRGPTGFVLAIAIASAVAVVAAAELHVQPLAREGRVFVSFELADGVDGEVLEAIHSGLLTTFTYDVELRREVALWFDRTLQAAKVSATVQYDNLTRQHQLQVLVDGRVQDARVTADPDAVRRALTVFERLPLFTTDGLDPNGEYDVRVRARTRPRGGWFLWPFDRGTATGRARFTFIP